MRTFAGTGDIGPWLALRDAAFDDAPTGVRKWTAADFEREMLSKPWWRAEHVWIAESAERPGQPVASVTLAGRGRSASAAVHWLLVAPAYRRLGIGRWLMSTLEAAAWQAGHRQVFLETHRSWTAAVALYTALGYRPDMS